MKHKNIVKTIEMFDNVSKGEFYHVMEYIEGKEIFEIICEKDEGKYTEDHTK